MNIRSVWAREILDSRGCPTVEAEVHLDSGVMGRAAVPSGASTGSFEACEKRDADRARYGGKGVQTVVEAIRTDLQAQLQGRPLAHQEDLDEWLCAWDGTPQKTRCGANATLAVSLAAARAAAISEGLPLYGWLQKCFKVPKPKMPCPMLNILNGGVHAHNGLSIQEFMIVPKGARDFKTALEWGVAVFQALKKGLKQRGFSVAVGDEGGFAPPLPTHRAALDELMAAIEQAGFKPGREIQLALDCAANEFFNAETHLYELPLEKAVYSPEQWVECLTEWTEAYPIVSIEDPLHEMDWIHWSLLTERLGATCQIVGDDLFATQRNRLEEGLQRQAANAILIKLNQVGTLSETVAAMRLAEEAGWGRIVSHRSGETEDTFIADLAVGLAAEQIKTGSPCRSERTAKYNQLLRIEESLGHS